MRAQWSYRQWLLMLALLVLPGQVAAGAMTWAVRAHPEATAPGWYNVFLAGVGVSVAAWLVGTLALSLRKRGQVPQEHRVGKGRSFLQGLRAIICPTLAALILLSVLGTWVGERGFQRAADRHRQILVQGEAQYYGLTEVGPSERDASP